MSIFLSKPELLLSDDIYKINLYVNNSLYKTLKVTKGERSETLGTADGNDNTYEFYGWSKSPTSTTTSYTSTSSIKPTSNMNLYAVFKHYVYTASGTISNYEYLARTDTPEKIYYFRAKNDCILKIYGEQRGSGMGNSIYRQAGNTGLRNFYINNVSRIYTPDSEITEGSYKKYVYNLSAGDILRVYAYGGSSGSNYYYTYTIYGQTSSYDLTQLTLNSEEYVLLW